MEAKMNNFLKNQGNLHPMNDIKLCVTNCECPSFSNEIEMVVLTLKFFSQKCHPYKRMKDHIAHVIHFKMVMEIVCFPKNKRDAMFCNLFIASF